jgi:hypothetical protein
VKVRHAKRLLKLMRREGHVTAEINISTDEGVLVTGLPLGFAIGSVHWCTSLTVVPRHGYSALFEGVGLPHHIRIPKMGPTHLWEQEAIIYAMERREAMKKALAELKTARYLPRPDEYIDGKVNSAVTSDPRPHPADFGITPGVRWEYSKASYIRIEDVRLIKQGFVELLEGFINKKEIVMANFQLADGPKHIIAVSDKEVGIMAAKAIPDEYNDKLDDVEICIRPF